MKTNKKSDEKTISNEELENGKFLVEAASNNNLSLAQSYIDAGASKEAVDQKGNPCLHTAVYKKNREMVTLLLNAGFDTTLEDSKERTAPELAGLRQRWRILTLFATYRQEHPKKNDKEKLSKGLLEAVKYRKHEVAEELMKAHAGGGCFDSRTLFGIEHMVIRNQDIKVLNLIIKHGYFRFYYRDAKHQTPLDYARSLGKKGEACLTIMLQHSSEEKKNFPLHYAVLTKNRERVTELLEGGDIDTTLKNKQGKTARELASPEQLSTILSCFPDYRKEDPKKTEESSSSEFVTPGEEPSAPSFVEELEASITHPIKPEIMEEPVMEETEDFKNGQFLIEAILNKNQTLAQSYIDLGASKIVVDREGNSCFHITVLNNSIDMVPLLLNAGFDTTLKNKQGKTAPRLAGLKQRWRILRCFADYRKEHPKKHDKENLGSGLFDAVKHGQHKVAEALMKAHADGGWCNLRTLVGIEHLAIRNQDIKMLNLIIKHGYFRFYYRDAKNRTPLDYARSLGERGGKCLEIITMRQNLPLHYAVFRNDRKRVTALLESGIDTTLKNQQGKTAPRLAGLKQRWGILRCFATYRQNHPKKHDKENLGSGLLEAVRHGQHKVAEALMKAHAGGSWRDSQTLFGIDHLAIKNQDIKMLNLIIKHGCFRFYHRNAKNQTPLDYARSLGKKGEEYLKIMLQHSSKENKNFPLHYAVLNNDRDRVTKLLESGIDTTVKNKQGNTAPRLASLKQRWRILRCFATYRQNHPKKHDKENLGSGLLEAVRQGQHKVAEALMKALASGSSNLSQTRFGIEHLAIENQDIKMLNLIIKHDYFRFDYRDAKNRTPLDYARSLGKEQCTLIIEAFIKQKKEKSHTEDPTSSEFVTPGEEPSAPPVEEEKNSQSDLLEALKACITCSITHDIMKDPVMLIETGHTYDRSAIEKWLSTHSTDPLTGCELKNREFKTNYALKFIIEKYNEAKNQEERTKEKPSEDTFRLFKAVNDNDGQREEKEEKNKSSDIKHQEIQNQ